LIFFISLLSLQILLHPSNNHYHYRYTMIFSRALEIILLGAVSVAAQPGEELPITTTDVFVQSGEISASSANVMARCNDESSTRMTIEFECEEGITCPSAQEALVGQDADFTNTFVVQDLDSYTTYEYTVTCYEAPSAAAVARASAGSATGSFKTAPSKDQEVPIKFTWAADLAGQGYGRNPDFEITSAVDGTTSKGGYIVFDTMAKLEPDFCLFQGDMIYADNSIPPSKEYTNGTEVLGVWTNNPSKDFIAVTLDEFRDNWKYNFGDDKMQAFLKDTPVFVQWDDHEVTNNWWPGE
jgi:alkaline phosphatase D